MSEMSQEDDSEDRVLHAKLSG